MDCNFVRTVALRVVAVALAVVCGVDSASAGSFRIAFADNDTSTDSSSNLTYKTAINAISEGAEYVSSFNVYYFSNIRQAKSGYGWLFGDIDGFPGKMKINFSESANVAVQRIEIGIISPKVSRLCLKLNDGEQITNIVPESNSQYGLTFNCESQECKTLYIINTPDITERWPQLYIQYIEVFFKDPAVMAFDKQEITVDFAQEVDVPEPTLTNPNGGTVAYSSDNEEVAKVDAETGEVSVCGIGVAVITAKSTPRDEVASYTLTVKDPEMQEAQQSFSGNESVSEAKVGDGHLTFTEAAGCSGGKVTFANGNSLKISAPNGCFLTAIEFSDLAADASADASVGASTGSVAAGKWLPAQGDVAVNVVELKANADATFSGLKISYLPFRIDHANTTTTVDFAATESTANSINFSSTIANSGKSTVDRFIIRANGEQIAEAQTDATVVDLTALPYLENARFTISPVIAGLERQAETLDGATLPNLSTINFTIGSQNLLFAPTDDSKAKITAFVRIAASAELPANMLQNSAVTVADYPGAICKYGDNAIDVYVPDYIAPVPMSGELPNLSGVEFPTLTISLTPTYQFFVAEDFRSLLNTSAERPLRANSLGDDGIQTVIYDNKELQAKFNSNSEVSLQIDPVADSATARYYNLQGIEVSPDAITSGIYIRRQGTTATKIHIRH